MWVGHVRRVAIDPRIAQRRVATLARGMTVEGVPLEKHGPHPRSGFSLLAVLAAVSAVELFVVLVVGHLVLGLTY